jgi:hypothetical protein
MANALIKLKDRSIPEAGCKLGDLDGRELEFKPMHVPRLATFITTMSLLFFEPETSAKDG